MRVLWQSIFLVAVLAMVGCGANNQAIDLGDGLIDTDGDGIADNDQDKDGIADERDSDFNKGAKDEFAPCTNAKECCPADQMKCVGDVDGQIVCTCSALWDCSKNPRKCEQMAPTPDGGTEWECKWTEFKYFCEKKGTKTNQPTIPPGNGEWACKFESEFSKWVCSSDTPHNPTNKPSGNGAWKCEVVTKIEVGKEVGKLVCERQGTDTPPTGNGDFTCVTKGTTKTCTQNGDKGLPPGGNGDWKCSSKLESGKTIWTCYSSGSVPPAGGGWTCSKGESEFGQTIKCSKPQTPSDLPPGGGWWSCVKSSATGTVCEQVPTTPNIPPPEGGQNMKCAFDDTMWCDGLTYCGWGQVKCDQKTGTWEMTTINGKKVLNCKEELAKGKVPNTVCACYHYFFNPSCCERPDCIVPKGTSGQVCPASPGKLCDYCNPLHNDPKTPQCKEAGSRCIVTNAHETFCGKDCSSSPCPQGYNCMNVKLTTGTVKQCVPFDYSCYY